jgi:hypothetical protein
VPDGQIDCAIGTRRRLARLPYGAEFRLLLKTKFSSLFNVIWVVQSGGEKYSAFLLPPIDGYFLCPALIEGRTRRHGR